MPALPTLLVRRSLAGVALVAVVAAGCGDDDDDATAEDTEETTDTTADSDTTEGSESGDVLEVAAAEGDLDTFLAALEAAGSMDSLHGEGPFTVFAPTEAAFTAYLDESGMTQAEVFGDATALQGLLDYHIVEMKEPSDMVMDMAGEELTTASGEPLPISAEGEDVMVGNAMVERYDITASNGVVHVIDHVLVPPSMAGG